VSPVPNDVLQLLDRFTPDDDEHAKESVRRTRDLLRRATDPFDRSHFTPGHMTASAVVLAEDHKRVLLVYHERLARWLQPGGHVEPGDDTIADTARREVLEETGVVLLERLPHIVGVDVHPIPAAQGEPPHYHHDIVFRLHAASEELRTPPGQRARWCHIRELRRYADDPLVRAVARATADNPRGET